MLKYYSKDTCMAVLGLQWIGEILTTNVGYLMVLPDSSPLYQLMRIFSCGMSELMKPLRLKSCIYSIYSSSMLVHTTL